MAMEQELEGLQLSRSILVFIGGKLGCFARRFLCN